MEAGSTGPGSSQKTQGFQRSAEQLSTRSQRLLIVKATPLSATSRLMSLQPWRLTLALLKYITQRSKKFVANGISLCPVLAMMQAVVDRNPTKKYSFAIASKSVRASYETGIPILGGTNSFPALVVLDGVSFGDGLHLELELLVQAGLIEVDALTSLLAGYYGLRDRGTIAEVIRADLILLGRDSLEDIGTSRDIKKNFKARMGYFANPTEPALTSESLQKLDPLSKMETK